MTQVNDRNGLRSAPADESTSESLMDVSVRAKSETIFSHTKNQHWLSQRKFIATHDALFGDGGEALLRAALQSGIVYEGERADLALVAAENLTRGQLQISADGYLGVRIDTGADVPVRRDESSFWNSVRDGDLVLARLPSGRSRYGKVLKVIQPVSATVVAEVIEVNRNQILLQASQPRMLETIKVRNRGNFRIAKGDTVKVEFSSPAGGRGRSLEARIMGAVDLPDAPDLKAEQLIAEFKLPADPWVLTPAVEAELRRVSEQEAMSSHRQDYRAIPFVTIDGATARDFDDALAVQKLPHGFLVRVAIADVAEFVKEGSEIDRSALERGTSVYFPNQVVPMLPPLLADDLCSLRPGEDRLAVVITMEMDRNGLRLESRVDEALIHSHRRLTYAEVKQFLEGEKEIRSSLPPAIAEELEILLELGRILRSLRASRGGLDFDLPEPYIEIGLRGEVTSVLRSERHLGHFLVEEMMIAANETVAETLTDAGYPLLYRVHDEPPIEKRALLESFLATQGIALPGQWQSIDLQKVIDGFQGMQQQKIVQLVALRSMAQAQYTPENIGHWGLVSGCYCHFTSPIRRYPDLVNHRLLKRYMRRGDLPEAPARRLLLNLKKIAPGLNERERAAEAAERAMVRHMLMRYAAESLGAETMGTIVSVTNFGLFVELTEPFCDGLVHVTELGDDHWNFDAESFCLVGKRSGRRWRLGDILKVRIARVDLDRDRLDLVPVWQ